MGRDDIIQQLASSMGAPVQSKFAESNYDKSTGTLYCNGHMITAGKIEQAKQYFERSKKHVESGSDIYIFCELALEAIERMQKSNVSNGNVFIK